MQEVWRQAGEAQHLAPLAQVRICTFTLVMANLHCVASLHDDSQAQSDAQSPIKASDTLVGFADLPIWHDSFGKSQLVTAHCEHSTPLFALSTEVCMCYPVGHRLVLMDTGHAINSCLRGFAA